MHCVMPKQKFMQLNNVFVSVAVAGFRNFDFDEKNYKQLLHNAKNDVVDKAMEFAEVGKHKKLDGVPFMEICERKIITDP
jgi:hypothetical protein